MMNLGENIEKGVSLTLIRHCTPLDSRKNMGDTGGSASNSKIKPVDEFQNDSIKKCLQIWQRKVKVEFLKKYLEKKSQKFSIREIPGRFFFLKKSSEELLEIPLNVYIYTYIDRFVHKHLENFPTTEKIEKKKFLKECWNNLEKFLKKCYRIDFGAISAISCWKNLRKKI